MSSAELEGLDNLQGISLEIGEEGEDEGEEWNEIQIAEWVYSRSIALCRGPVPALQRREVRRLRNYHSTSPPQNWARQQHSNSLPPAILVALIAAVLGKAVSSRECSTIWPPMASTLR